MTSIVFPLWHKNPYIFQCNYIELIHTPIPIPIPIQKRSRLERLQISQFKQIQAMSGAKALLRRAQPSVSN